MALDLSSLKKAVKSLDESIKVVKSKEKRDSATKKVVRAGVIQNFEFTYELCWKFMQRWLRENQGQAEADLPKTRKELFRMAARSGLISNPEPWFKYSEARNLTVHTYSEDVAKDVFKMSVKFIKEAKEFLENIEAKND